MRTALIVLALLAAPAFAAQTVWKWVDDKGVTHYSDQPVPGAQRVEISAGSRSDPVSIPSPSSSASRSDETADENYRNFEIRKPADRETITNTGGAVDVSLRYEPALQRGHSVYLYLDGQLVPEFPPNGLEFTLQNVARGMHSLTAIIQDGNGKRLQQSALITFYVHQESVAQPPVGPTLRPPPRPRNR